MRVRKKLPYYLIGALAVFALSLIGPLRAIGEKRESISVIRAVIPSASYIYEEVTSRFYMGVEFRKGFIASYLLRRTAMEGKFLFPLATMAVMAVLYGVMWKIRSERIWNPKRVILAAVFLPMRDMVVAPLIRASEEMGSPLGGLESSIATMNSWLGVLLLTLTYMLLMSSFPTADGNVRLYQKRVLFFFL